MANQSWRRHPSPTDGEVREYLVKRMHKRAMKVAKKLKNQTVTNYPNESNPFGDANLNEKFVWRKKIERDVALGATLHDFSLGAEKKRQRELIDEIAKVKKQRETRDLEKARREEQMRLVQRMQTQEEADDVKKMEDEFEFNQCKNRSRIRLLEGRAKAIDVLTAYLDETDQCEVELDEPYMVFKGLTVKEMEELYDDIKLYVNFDRATATHIEYWDAFMVVCESELNEARRKEAIDQTRLRGECPPAELLAGAERGLHLSVKTDAGNIFEEMRYENLINLQAKIESELRCGKSKEVDYWEDVLKRVHVSKAKSCLKEIHAKMPRRKLNHVEQPVIMSNESSEVDTMDEFVDRTERVMGAMEKGEAVFGSDAEVNLDSHVYWWHNKYRPRKPRYFNRVHTGYLWNKYNRTHFDHDNPPPKIVQGYKFNLFYPELINKANAPTYFIEKDGDSTETCIIRFQAGPPYEDIAFRIVNKEWEHSHKKGYKCTFDRGILQLYFNFKRYPYRR